jgi:hypothetical protein
MVDPTNDREFFSEPVYEQPNAYGRAGTFRLHRRRDGAVWPGAGPGFGWFFNLPSFTASAESELDLHIVQLL